MKNLTKTIVIISFFALALQGCGKVKQDNWADFCTNTIWEHHGEFDATNGYSFKMIEVYKERCGNQFSQKEITFYQNGYIKGLVEYCTYDNGYKIGFAGKKLPELCPHELSDQFAKGFKIGQLEFKHMKQKVKRLDMEEQLNTRLRTEKEPLLPAK